jgi:transposase
VRPAEHDRPDVARARTAWHAAAPSWDPAHLVFLDETGVTTNLLRRYGRAARGARVHDHTPGARWQTSTFLAALRVTGLTAPGVFDGAIDGPSFLAYIEQILVPTLHPGDLVIADNLNVHKVAGVRVAIARASATLVYLPPYSPDLNPIELCFAKLKAIVRAARCRSIETLWPLLGDCLQRFSPDECRNYFRHCGYTGGARRL